MLIILVSKKRARYNRESTTLRYLIIFAGDFLYYEANKAFIDLAYSVPDDMLPAVSAKVEQYTALHGNDNGAVNLIRVQTEGAARRELDPALKHQQDRSRTHGIDIERDR